MTNNTTAPALTDEQLTIQWAIESIEASAKSLQECHTQNGTWGDDTEAQSMFEREMEIASALRALLTSPRAASVPPGWKLVPIERSYNMRAKALIAFNTTEKKTNDRDDALDAAHRAMLDAAPAAPVAELVMQPLTDAALREALDEFELVCENDDVRRLTDDEKYAAQEFALSLIHGDPSGAPVAEAEPTDKLAPTLILTGAQLQEAIDFIAPDRAADQLESEVSFQYGKGHDGEGMYCWATEYPDEGAMKIDGSTVAAQAVAAPMPDENSAEFRAACKMAAKAGAAGIGPCGVFIAGYRVIRGIAVDVGEPIAQAVAADGAAGKLTQEVIDFCWNGYKTGQISADHTAKEVFTEVIQSLAAWVAKRAAVSPATAETSTGMPDEVRESLMDSQYLAGVTAGWNAANADDPNAALEKIHASRAGCLRPLRDWQKAGRPGVPATPATADERAAFVSLIGYERPETEGCAVDVWDSHRATWSAAIEFARASQAAAPAEACPTDDALWDQTLRERDEYHEAADKLAAAIAKYLGVDIGEHSNLNCPWDQALDAIENARPVVPADAGEAVAPVVAALRKLVHLKSLKDGADRCVPGYIEDRIEYQRDKPKAWDDARAALASFDASQGAQGGKGGEA